MLEPNDRSLLTEMLQPPRGFSLRQAVGTTFTLDLATALTVPLSFVSHRLAENDDVGIIAALAQYTDRITIFTQAGHISPGVDSDLVALLEEVIHPVNPPRGIFHPKVWFLEYERGEDRKYRFLCLSRNLTEDRSWDLCVRLDGFPAREHRQAASAEMNQPLVDLLHALPGLTLSSFPDEREQQLDELAQSFSTVEWELPPGVEELAFHLLDGNDPTRSNGKEMLDFPAKRALVISPFLSVQGLRIASRHIAEGITLVSRAETIDQLPQKLADQITDAFVLDDLLTEVEGTEAGALSGLHAKALFIQERRRYTRARAFIGSANVTDGGLRSNVEMMVELRGRIHQLGPEKVLDSLRPMLEGHPITGEYQSDPLEAEQQALQEKVRRLAAGKFHAQVFTADPYGMRVWCEPDVQDYLQQLAAEGIEVTWKLLTQPSGSRPFPMGQEPGAEIHRLEIADITPFIRISASQRIAGKQIPAHTVVLAELHDDIDQRRDAILARGIADGEAFFKLLALLLNPNGADASIGAVGGQGAGGWGPTAGYSALFEALLKSLARGDDGLEVVNRILIEIQSHSEGQVELPEGFTDLWNNVWQARSKQLKGGRS